MALSPCRMRTRQAEESPLEPLTLRKTCKYTLQPTAAQEGTMAFILRRCRDLSNAALQERRDAWRMRRVRLTPAGQRAQLPDRKEARPD